MYAKNSQALSRKQNYSAWKMSGFELNVVLKSNRGSTQSRTEQFPIMVGFSALIMSDVIISRDNLKADCCSRLHIQVLSCLS